MSGDGWVTLGDLLADKVIPADTKDKERSECHALQRLRLKYGHGTMEAALICGVREQEYRRVERGAAEHAERRAAKFIKLLNKEHDEFLESGLAGRFHISKPQKREFRQGARYDFKLLTGRGSQYAEQTDFEEDDYAERSISRFRLYFAGYAMGANKWPMYLFTTQRGGTSRRCFTFWQLRDYLIKEC